MIGLTQESSVSRFRRSFLCLFAAGAVLSAGWKAAGQTPVTAGYRDFSYGTTGNSTPTGEKPESKLWFHDGSWWGDLWNASAADYHIYRLDLASHTWIDTGTTLDTRSSKGDVFWDAAAGKLYLVSHLFATNAEPTSANWGRLFRYSYQTATRTYTPDSGFPVDITRGTAETLTVAKDSTGRLWATWVQRESVGGTPKVWVNHSLSADNLWGTPFVLPVSAGSVALDPDDISAIVAFGGNKVGVMWSNQPNATTYFAVHRDGDADNVWSLEIVLPGAACAGACTDDHISLKADQSGRVFAALKTSLTGLDSPEVMVGVREVTGAWNAHTVGRVRDGHTRAIIQLDEANQTMYVFATTPETGGTIYYKSSPMDPVQFPVGVGTPFIISSQDAETNNATSSKHNATSESGILVMASDQVTHFYLHNYLSLTAGPSSPQITSFSPTSGPVGTAVTINGSNFTGATAVAFNGTAASFSVASSSQINATVPSGATSGPISVTGPGGTGSSASSFTVTVPPAAPVVTSFSPTSGPVGTAVTIDGSNFTGASAVAFNGTGATFSVASATQINATVPAGATSGPISVTGPGGAGSSASSFTVTVPPAAPVVTSFSPTSGPVGTAVTIDGSNFTGATGVAFNGTGATFSVASSSRIDATVPSGATSGPISVTGPGGTGSSASSFTVIVPPPDPPSIASFSPASGPVGTAVTIDGSNFTGATAVAFNGTAASFTVTSGTEINATVPSGATSGTITVTGPGGTDTSDSTFTVILPDPPSVTSFSPGSGPVGTTVSIAGSSFTGATGVDFNGIPATFTVVSDSQIDAGVPFGATTGPIAVTNEGGSGISEADFVVTAPQPSISSFSPATGPVGATVTINGSNFIGASGVAFNGTFAAFTVLSSAQVRATVPAGAITGPITVTTEGGTATSSTDFTVGPVQITSFSPTSGGLGTVVTIRGNHFTGATRVTFHDVSASFTPISDAEIQAVVPATNSGTVKVTTPAGTATSSSSFTFIKAPTINSFSPTSGRVGTTVTIKGKYFTTTTGVSFNGVPATFTIRSDRELRATVPSGATTGRITVITRGGSVNSSSNFTVTP